MEEELREEGLYDNTINTTKTSIAETSIAESLIWLRQKQRQSTLRMAYFSYLKKRKTVSSGSGRNAVPTPPAFAYLRLDGLQCHISQRSTTVTTDSIFPRGEL